MRACEDTLLCDPCDDARDLGAGREAAMQPAALGNVAGLFYFPHLAYLIWSDLVCIAASGRRLERFTALYEP